MSYALVTGASKGIGKAFAENLAAKKYDLLLVSRSGVELEQVSKELQSRYGIKCSYLSMDLSRADGVEQVVKWMSDNQFEISVLINNAGYALWGRFDELALNEQNNIISVNISALVNLTYRLLPFLRKQPKAYILNVASATGYQAMPTFSIYAATKTFVISFTRALHHEMKDTNVSVTCLTPGSVKTGFVQHAQMPHMQELSDKVAYDPDAIAKAGLNAMFAGKIEAVPGFLNFVGVFANRFISKSFAEKMVAKIYMKKEK